MHHPEAGSADPWRSWRYDVVWRPVSPRPVQAPGAWLAVVPEHPGPDGDWVRGWTDGSASASDGGEVRVLRLPDGADRAAVAELLRREAAAGPVDGVVSFLAAAEAPHPREPSMAAGVLGTLVLIQALGDAGIAAPLWCLTTGAVSVGSRDVATRPGAAHVWGLGCVARLEHPDRWGGLVDVPADPSPDSVSRLWAVLGGHSGEDEVAVRTDGLYGRRVEAAPPLPARTERWRPRGTALVVGGTGALGACVADWLAVGGCERIVLASRTPDADDLADRLAALGAKVTVHACDVADRAAVEALATRLRAEGAPVRSVLHCAGSAQSTGLREMTEAEFAAVCAAKTAGAANLDAVFGTDLDAFVLFGCFPGVWGSYGRGASAAADAFLAAFARRRRAAGGAATAIAWGAWAVGGTLANPMVVEQLRRGGVTPMPPDDALTSLNAMLTADAPSDLVIDIDWPAFLSVFTARRPSRLVGHLASGRGRALADLPPAQRAEALRDLVRIEVAAAFGLSRPELVAMDRPLGELGGGPDHHDALAARLSAATGLAPMSVPAAASPTALAAALDDAFATAVDRDPPSPLTAPSPEGV